MKFARICWKKFEAVSCKEDKKSQAVFLQFGRDRKMVSGSYSLLKVVCKLSFVLSKPYNFICV